MFTSISSYLLEAYAFKSSAQIMTQGFLYWITLPKVRPVALCRTPFANLVTNLHKRSSIIIDLETLDVDCLTLSFVFLVLSSLHVAVVMLLNFTAAEGTPGLLKRTRAHSELERIRH